MFDIDKNIKKLLGNSKNIINNKWNSGLFVKNDSDGDRVPNGQDCQPFNVMRQDKIKKPYEIKHKGLWIAYGDNVLKRKESAIMINEVERVLRDNPRLVSKSKGLYGIEVETYKPRGSIARFHFTGGFTKDNKFVYKRKPVIFLQANPTVDEIKKYGKKKAELIYKNRVKQELQHEFKHYEQHKKGKLIKVKKGKIVKIDKRAQEAEALKTMTPTHYYVIYKDKKYGKIFNVEKYKTKKNAYIAMNRIKSYGWYFVDVLTPTQFDYLRRWKKITTNRIKSAKEYS